MAIFRPHFLEQGTPLSRRLRPPTGALEKARCGPSRSLAPLQFPRRRGTALAANDVNLPARHRCGMTETPWGQLARLPNVGSRIFRGGSSLSVMIQDHWTGDWAGVRGLRCANSSEMLRMSANGRIDDRLLGRLESEARSRLQSRQQELRPLPAPTPNPGPPPERGLFGSVLGGLQRLLGRDFDSLRQPAELVDRV
jgi:hypothetical protein